MSKKLQSFFIFKFNTNRLKQSNYKIKLNLQEARRNNEIIMQADNAVFRALRKIKNNYFDSVELLELQRKKKEIKRLSNTKENKKNLLEIEKKIDDLLFIPEIISVKVSDNRHYKKIINKGLQVNGINFKRLLCGSGQARRNTVLMISEEYYNQILDILDNGRNKKGQIVLAKYNAYMGLASSGGWQVSIPNIIVVKDCVVKRNVDVEYISEGAEDIIEPRNMELEFNLFDGQGLINPDFAEKWANDLELDYIPSSFVVRSAFLKGQLVTFDIKRFSREISHQNIVVDVWGNEHNILDADVIVSESQLKLWSFYNNLDDYLNNCRVNDFGWSVSRYAPKKDKTTVKTNYQFLQVLDLNDEQIKSLCQKTIDFFKDSILDDYRITLLYLLGNYVQEDIDEKWLDGVGDIVTKAIIYNPELLHDPYIQQHIIKSLNKKIRESYIGNLYVDGNYQAMVSDPYAQCEFIFGMDINGLLGENEYYSYFWNKQDVTRVVAMRAPLTWKSESNILDLKINNRLDDWLSYNTSGIIYNVFGVDDMLHADSDRDGDLCFTSNQKEIIDGSQGGLPITYQKLVANKSTINYDELYKYDLLAFGSKVGFITNVSTTLYCMLSNYPKDSDEYDELTRRLKMCRLLQGREIDGAKGIIKKPMPKEWSRWQKKTSDMMDEEKNIIDFENKLIADSRPYFMRYLYGNYNYKYKKFIETFESISQCRLGCSIQDVLSKSEYDLNDEELKIKQGFDKFNPLLDTNSVMNKISHYLEGEIKELKLCVKKTNYNPSVLINKNIPIDNNKLALMKKLYNEYKTIKRNYNREENNNDYDGFQNISQEFHLKMEKISSNESELVNLLVQILYIENPRSSSKDILWSILSDGLLSNIQMNSGESYLVPVIDTNGSFEFMGKTYEMREIYV